MAGEISDKDSQSRVYTLIAVGHPRRGHPASSKPTMQVSYRIGQTVGQPIGGLLAHPERRWPELFAGGFWAEYPFSLPCFVGAGFALCAVAFAAIELEEVGLSLAPIPSSLLQVVSRPAPPGATATTHPGLQ
jgi:hypothetical protein